MLPSATEIPALQQSRSQAHPSEGVPGLELDQRLAQLNRLVEGAAGQCGVDSVQQPSGGSRRNVG